MRSLGGSQEEAAWLCQQEELVAVISSQGWVTRPEHQSTVNKRLRERRRGVHNGLIQWKWLYTTASLYNYRVTGAQSESDLPSPVVVLQQLHFLTDQLNLSVFHGMDQNLQTKL